MSEFDLDAAYGVDDEMQEEIEKLKADPFELLPDKNGFKPSALVPEPKEGSDERSVWYNTEIGEVVSANVMPLKNDAQEIEGQVAHVTFRVKRGPNESKEIDQSFWFRDAEPESIRESNAKLQDLFKALKVNPDKKKLPDGRAVLTYLGSLEKLKGRLAKLRVQQKWDHPWKKQGGRFVQLEDEPKRFKKKIVDIRAT
jgi:hypothetical protein